MTTKRQVQDWNRDTWESKNRAMYATHGRNQWPWFVDHLDPDIAEYLLAANLKGQHILDVGTCSGVQAIELARLGHRVVATDISETALEQAKLAAGKSALTIDFRNDDVADSKLGDDAFDLAVDRGCYHSICSFNHEEYVANVRRVLKPRGVLLLKVMSSDEPRFTSSARIDGRDVQMAFHFTVKQLEALFSPHFVIETRRDSHFHSSVLDDPARAHFLVLRNTK